MKTQILLLVFGLVFVVRAAPQDDQIQQVIDVAMKDLEDFVESAEAEIEALLKDVSPEDAEEAMNKAGITEEDLDEAENEVEESLEELEDEVEKGDVSEGDVEEVYTAVGDDADA